MKRREQFHRWQWRWVNYFHHVLLVLSIVQIWLNYIINWSRYDNGKSINTASEHITKMMRYTIGHLVTIIPNERQFVDGRCQVVDMFVYWWQWFYFIRANNRVLFEIMKHAIQLQLWVDDWFMTVLVKDVNESRWVETTLWTKPFVGMRGSIEPYKR